MRFLPFRATALFLLAAACAPLFLAPPARATPISATMHAGVAVDLSPQGTTTGLGSSGMSWATTPAGLSAAASRTAANEFGSSINAYANGTATWAANGNSGTATLNYGWTITDGGDYPFVSAQTGLDLPNWSYTFTADLTGDFTMNYSFAAPGGLPPYGAGLQGFSIGTIGGNVVELTALGSGVYSQAVTAGATYTVYFQNHGSLYDGLDNVGVTGTFNWTLPGNVVVTNTPDSGASLLLFAAALGALTLAAGRRRGLVASRA